MWFDSTNLHMKRGTFRVKSYTEKLAVVKRVKKVPVKKKKKVKEKTLTWWRKQAWTVFSKWIRTRDNFQCFTCGKKAEGGGMHAAHFMTGASCPPSLYFHEANVHAGCYHCNINLSGNWVVYIVKMEEKYGKEFVENLQKMRRERQGEKWYQEDYQKIIDKYS